MVYQVRRYTRREEEKLILIGSWVNGLVRYKKARVALDTVLSWNQRSTYFVRFILMPFQMTAIRSKAFCEDKSPFEGHWNTWRTPKFLPHESLSQALQFGRKLLVMAAQIEAFPDPSDGHFLIATSVLSAGVISRGVEYTSIFIKSCPCSS